MLGLAAAAEEEEEEGGREEAMACRFMCCLCLCKQSAGKGRTCSRLALEMQLYTVIHVIIVQIKV